MKAMKKGCKPPRKNHLWVYQLYIDKKALAKKQIGETCFYEPMVCWFCRKQKKRKRAE